MDIELEKDINDVIEYLNAISVYKIEYQLMDPIAKMMLVALLHESKKIKDYIDGIDEKITDKFCETFIPRKQVEAMPALSLLEARFKPKRDTEIVYIENPISFTYKLDSKQNLNYIPIFKNLLIPYSNYYILTPNRMRHGQDSYNITMEKRNCIWIGVETRAEIECLKGLSIIIEGTRGIDPEHIFIVGQEEHELEQANMSKLEEIEMIEPFGSQQSSGSFFSFIDEIKENLQDLNNASLLYITDDFKDRDIFKPRAYPRIFQNWLESEILDCFKNETLWLRIEFPDKYIVPDDCTITLNVIPVVNIDINTLTLTQTSPIAKLQKQENTYFLNIVETSTAAYKQGFEMSKEEIIVRDFDASCYNNGNLYRDIRNMYNHFIDDYYAFIEYNGIKDGETIKLLRESFNKIGKSAGHENSKYKFDSGTYVMKNMNQYPLTSTTKVTYLTTYGKLGNTPKKGETMENKKLPSIEKEMSIILSGIGGTDKATADERYELLRYYSLTNDRLYTKKDIEAFLRKEIISEFGKEEFKRIFINIKIEGTGGEKQLQRGLYITITFKDKKNYDKACKEYFDIKLQKRISYKSCITLPVIVNFINNEI